MNTPANLELILQRLDPQPTPKVTKGVMYANGVKLGYTCEDQDRLLESGAEKVKGETAIPRGKYRVIISFSNRFQRMMPEVLDVPGFAGVRIHGGNTVKDTEGCPLLGMELTPTGVRNCSAVNTHLMHMLGETLQNGGKCWITVM